MSGCGEERALDGRLIFAGIRVRLGISWAPAGSIVALLNQRTKTFNVRGPGMDAAVAVSDAAYGGQTILTQAVWDMVCAAPSICVLSRACLRKAPEDSCRPSQSQSAAYMCCAEACC